MARVDVGQGDRDDRSTAGRHLRLDRVEEGSPGSPGSTTTTALVPTRTVLAGRPAGPKACRPVMTRQTWSQPLDPDRRLRPERQPVADRLVRVGPLEPLERGGGRRPHRDPTGRHLGQGRAGREPGVPGDLAGMRAEDGVGRELGHEEAGGEPTRVGPRRRPARHLHERVGAELEVELGGERPEGRRRPTRTPRRRSSLPSVGRGGPRPPPRSRGSRRSDARHRSPGSRSDPGPGSRGPGRRPTRRRRPPGKTWRPAAKAIESGRRVRRTSRPREPGRTSTIVAAGRATTGASGRPAPGASSRAHPARSNSTAKASSSRSSSGHQSRSGSRRKPRLS